jgi:hypothetical protein
MLGCGALLVALGAALVAAHVTVFALDETLIEQSAVHYTSDLPNSLFHDVDARATNRLYSLVLSIAFHMFGGASAVRVDHVLSVLMFVSAALPIFLIAKVLLRSEWFAAWVALLSIAVPWLTLTSALFTENLSYPLFWWSLLAVCRAVWRPSALRDAIAILVIALLVCTRVQFAAVFVGYAIAAMSISIWRAEGGSGIRRRLTGAARELVRGYPLMLAALAAVVAFVVYENVSGQWESQVEQLLGTYSSVVIRNGVPSNMVQGLLVELIALALGVGLIPALVSLVWLVKRLSRPTLDRRWSYLVVSTIVIVAFLVLTVFSQGGYLGQLTEERYFFYVIPVFWLGTFAALEDRNVRARELVLASLGLAAIYGSIPFLSYLSQETAFLAPMEAIVPHLLSRRLLELGLPGLTVQDALAVLTLVAGVLTAMMWRARGRVRLWLVVGSAVAVQLVLTGYAFAVIDGKVQGIRGRTAGSVDALGWLDRNARSGNVAWLDNLTAAAPPATPASSAGDQARTTLFWNSRLRSRAEVAQLALPPVEWPLSALPAFMPSSVNRVNGLLEPPSSTSGLTEVVGGTGSAFLQLAGTALARSPDGVLTLTRLSMPIRARWLSLGLQPDGAVVSGALVRLVAFAPRSASPQRLDVALTLGPPPTRSTVSELSIRLGDSVRRVKLAAAAHARQLRLSVCLVPGVTHVDGDVSARRLPPAARKVVGVIERVETTRIAGTRSRCQNLGSLPAQRGAVSAG